MRILNAKHSADILSQEVLLKEMSTKTAYRLKTLSVPLGSISDCGTNDDNYL